MSEPEASATVRNPGGLAGLYLKAMTIFAGLATGSVVAIMLVQIVARYVFNSSLIWAEELCRYILVWQTFLLIGIAYHHGELVILDLLTDRVSPRVKLLIRTLATLPVLYFLYLLVTTGWAHATRFQAQTIPAIDFIWMSLTGKPANVPVFWVYVAAPIGCAILFGHLAVGLFDDMRRVFFPAPAASAESV